MSLPWENLLAPYTDPVGGSSVKGKNLWFLHFDQLLQRRLMGVAGEPGWFAQDELQTLLSDRLGVGRDSELHASSSCILILEGTCQTALVHHLKRREWFYPGGHADGNWNWFLGSVKECVEETGARDLVALLRPEDITKNFILPAFVVKHRVLGSCESESHFHLDFVYLFETRKRDLQFRASESAAVKWFDCRELGSQDLSAHGISKDTRRIFERIGLHVLPGAGGPAKWLRFSLPQERLNSFADLTGQT